MNYNVCCSRCYIRVIRRLAETCSQSGYERGFGHGWLLQIPSLIIISRVVPTAMELQRGSLEVSYSRNGRRTAPYCGSAAIVRFSLLEPVMLIDISIFFSGIRKKCSLVRCFTNGLMVRNLVWIQFGHSRGHQAYLRV